MADGIGGVGWVSGVHSHFHVQPNHSVEVVLRLCCVVVEVLTIQSKVFNLVCSAKHTSNVGEKQLLTYELDLEG